MSIFHLCNPSSVATRGLIQSSITVQLIGASVPIPRAKPVEQLYEDCEAYDLLLVPNPTLPSDPKRTARGLTDAYLQPFIRSDCC